MKTYTIGQLANLTDLSTKALRIYEAKGLITSFRNEENNYRYFEESVKLQLQRIQTLKYLGFSLDEIEKMLVHFNQVNLEESFLEQKMMMEKKAFELDRMIHCMDKAATACKENRFDLDEVFRMLNHIIMDRKADEGVGFLRHHAATKEPEGWSMWIFDQIGMRPGMRILDAGAGYGNLWRYNLYRIPQGTQVTCVDLHNTHADTFYNEYKDNEMFRFVWDNLETMALDGKYDLIIFNHVMAFIEDKEKLLKKFRKALNPGGKLICTWGGGLLFEEIAKLLITFRPEQEKRVLEGLVKRKEPLETYENTIKNVFHKVEHRARPVSLCYDSSQEFISYIRDISKLGFDFSNCEEEFKVFIEKQYPDGNYQIDRDGYLYICEVV